MSQSTDAESASNRIGRVEGDHNNLIPCMQTKNWASQLFDDCFSMIIAIISLDDMNMLFNKQIL